MNLTEKKPFKGQFAHELL